MSNTNEHGFTSDVIENLTAVLANEVDSVGKYAQAWADISAGVSDRTSGLVATRALVVAVVRNHMSIHGKVTKVANDYFMDGKPLESSLNVAVRNMAQGLNRELGKTYPAPKRGAKVETPETPETPDTKNVEMYVRTRNLIDAIRVNASKGRVTPDDWNALEELLAEYSFMMTE